MRMETDVRDWIRELEMFQYWNGLYILMVAGAIIVIISFCGCCGALTNNILLMTIGASCVIITLILEITGGVLILVHGTEYSKLTPFLTTTLDKLILDSNYNANANHYLITIQEKVGCCGSRSYLDYSRNNLPISDSCRDAISGNVYQQGCVEKFSIFIEKRAGWIAGIAIFVAVLQLLLVFFTFCYIRSVRGNDEVSPKTRYHGVPTNA